MTNLLTLHSHRVDGAREWARHEHESFDHDARMSHEHGGLLSINESRKKDAKEGVSREYLHLLNGKRPFERKEEDDDV